jgi:tetratricopeptide (TPR) repeat protein
MSNKQRRREKQKAKKKKQKRALRSQAHAEPPPLPDRRVMERVMWGMFGGHEEDTEASYRAQDLIYDAVEKEDPELRVKMAHKALAIWPDCADAYVLLAENALSLKEELEMYERGVAAGERALGPKIFQEDAGHFWGILESRPYMRARHGLAFSLWASGRREEAVEHLQDMLRLNPNDNQGVRYTLAEYLLNLNRDDDLVQLLEQFSDEGSCMWEYTRALITYRRNGDTPERRRWLQEAKKSNSHVPDYLLGRQPLPAEQPSYYTPGEESEAIIYAHQFLSAWKSTPGAITWLRASEQSTEQSETDAPEAPPAVSLDHLMSLPIESDIWQADCRQLPTWFQEEGQPIRPWNLIVASRTNDLALGQETLAEQPGPAALWKTLAQTMQEPLAGEPHRPTELHVLPGKGWESLQASLEELGIRLVMADHLDMLDHLLEGITQILGMRKERGLLDAPGVTPVQVARLYEAAADYFLKAPWRLLANETPLKIECDRFQSGPWYAIVMGKIGTAIGLTLYNDLKVLKKLLTGCLSEKETARLTVATTVLFGEAMEIPVADLEAAERHGWKVAAPEAYPWFFHKERGQSVRPLLAWEIELMEAALRAVPDFVRRHRPDDPAPEEMTVSIASGPVEMRLAWVVD